MTRRLRPAIGASLLLCCACAPALRGVPPVAEVAGPPHHGPEQVDGLLAGAAQAFAARELDDVREARRLWLAAAAADPARRESWIGATRAAVWLAGKESDSGVREATARSAVQCAQLCAAADPADPACAYWLAVALGVQARERRTTALDALERMVELLERAAAQRPRLEHAGPHRVLALVLVRAPGWPTGPGDAELGLEHARQAVALDPDHPPNQMCLAETLAAVDDDAASLRAWERARELAAAAAAARNPEAAEWLEEIDAALRGTEREATGN